VKRVVAAALGLFALGSLSRQALAACPCYTAASANNTHNCGVDAVNGTNPDTATWNGIFALVSQGPSAWGNQGPAVGDIGQGCGKPEPDHAVPATFPCELLKAIAKVESGWRQFCVPTSPADEVGGASRTIISFDCGYGVGQVTSGMHKGESPGFDRAKVAGDATYNLATGTLILAAKWKATKCVGDNQPSIIEDWYTAAWAYNGLAYVNNPSNPSYDPNRGVWDPAVGGAAPYQEHIFGWMEHTGGAWPSTPLAYPNPGDVGATGSPPDLPEPKCASPTDCANTRPVHPTACGAMSSSSSSSSSTGSSSSSSSSGAGGSVATSTSSSGASSGSSGTGGSSGSSGGSSGGGFGGDVPASSGDDGSGSGCTCEAGAPARNGTSGLLAVLGLGVALAARRPRARRRSGSPGR
jgi:hypothetical protein